MLDALRHCEPDIPTLNGSNASMDFFSQSIIPVSNEQTSTLASGSLHIDDGIISSTSSPNSPASNTVVHTLAEIYDRELVSTIGWAKQIPGVYQLIYYIYKRLITPGVD